MAGELRRRRVPRIVTFRAKLTVIEVVYTIQMVQGSDRSMLWSINQVA
jgi:hypothetical protein